MCHWGINIVIYITKSIYLLFCMAVGIFNHGVTDTTQSHNYIIRY